MIVWLYYFKIMENVFEKKIGETRDEKKQRKEVSKKEQRNIAIIIGEYMDFFNESDLLMKLKDTEFGFDADRAREILDKKLAPLPERIDDLKEKGVNLKKGNSLIDILSNSVHAYKMLAEKRMNKRRLENLSAITEADRKVLDNLKKNLEAVLYYIDFLCCDNEKLKMELIKRSGYLEKFKNYFFKKEVPKGENRMVAKIIYPTGTKKIDYFRFFNEWEQGNIDKENLEEELEKLDSEFINKEKVREDFEKSH